MAIIQTERHLVVAATGGTGSLSVEPGKVIDAVDNEGVQHTSILSPDEAVAKGVALIQLAHQARAMAAAMAMHAQQNGQANGHSAITVVQR